MTLRFLKNGWQSFVIIIMVIQKHFTHPPIRWSYMMIIWKWLKNCLKFKSSKSKMIISGHIKLIWNFFFFFWMNKWYVCSILKIEFVFSLFTIIFLVSLFDRHNETRLNMETNRFTNDNGFLLLLSSMPKQKFHFLTIPSNRWRWIFFISAEKHFLKNNKKSFQYFPLKIQLYSIFLCLEKLIANTYWFFFW